MRLLDLLRDRRTGVATGACMGLVVLLLLASPSLPSVSPHASPTSHVADRPSVTDGVARSTTVPLSPAESTAVSLHFPIVGGGPHPVASPISVPTPAPVTPTNTPEPTKAPTKTLAERHQPVTKVSKLGIGVYGLHAGDSELEVLLEAQPAVLLLQDPNIGFARDVRKLFPNAFIIGRVFFAEQPLDDPERRGVEIADKVAEFAVPRKDLIDAWMSYNEVVSHNDFAAYEAYNRFQVAFARRLQDHYGISAVAGNDAPGAVEPEDYVKYFAEAIQASDYFGIHAYSKPDSLTLRTPDAKYYALRYRLIHRELEKAGIHDVKMVITEAGLAEGWRYTVPPRSMADDFFWMADELEKDPYMIGMAIYGVFSGSGRPGWEAFDLKYTILPSMLGEYEPRRAEDE